jgi:phosphoglycolate phosphatase
VLLNYTCRCAASPQVKLNDEAQSFRWVTPADAMRMMVNAPTLRLLEAVLSPAPARRR